ncbi:MAG: hypothetical protein AVDCRST_MAG96-1489 [uncultured Segetibacter sp.]|uniref:Uncharacterized protein n=1 Tax=uncultured Segetibacter sp. TaxID=481133 RepID=A0A6J4SFM0_9BACT|nr:MAG: hypothetical protein AVDCRST_MAG96-1489 [uncultured Segetibacter sp.]
MLLTALKNMPKRYSNGFQGIKLFQSLRKCSVTNNICTFMIH